MDLEALIVPLTLNLDKFKSQIQDAKSESTGLGSGLSNLGLGIAAAGVAAAGAAITGFAVLTNKTIDYGNSLRTTEKLLGMNSEQAAGWALVADRAGVSSDDANSAMLKFDKGLESVGGKAGNAGKELAVLGIATEDANGKMKPASDLFSEVATKLDGMPDGLQKDAMEMNLFGKSGTDMNDMLHLAANGGMADFVDQAKNMGLALTDTQINQTHEIEENSKKFDETLKGLGITLTSAVLPALDGLGNILNSTLANPQIKAGIADIGTGIGNFAMTVVSKIPQVITFLTQLPAWFQANQPIVVGILAILGTALIAFGVTSAVAMATAMAPMLPLIALIVAIGVVAGLLFAAWQSDFGGIREKTESVLSWITTNFGILKNWLEVNIPAGINILKGIWDVVWGQIQGIVGDDLKVIQDLGTAFTDLFSGNWHKFGEDIRQTAQDAWKLVTDAVTLAWTNIQTAVGTGITAVINFFKTTDWGSVGTAIIQGIANGITSGLHWITDAAKNAAQAALDIAKGILGIKSPSTVFAGIGQNMMLGWAQGINTNSQLPVNATMAVSTNLPNSANNNNAELTSAIKSMNNQPMRLDSRDIRLIGKAFAEELAKVSG